MKWIDGGVTAPKGFKATGVACGLKKNGKPDIALLRSDVPAAAAGVFTTNVVKGHSLKLSMKNIQNGVAQAVIINSGNANACVGEEGDCDALQMAQITAKVAGVREEDVLTASTGVIGKRLDMDKVAKGIELAANALSYEGGHLAEEAIMTTDLQPKECAVQFELNGKTLTLGGMAKGSGMIHPNMATMIGVLTTDAAVDATYMKTVLKRVVDKSFNRVSVDGDTSVCDKVLFLANGLAGNTAIDSDANGGSVLEKAMEEVCTQFARMIAADGEGATKLIEIRVNGAANAEDAYKIVCSVAKSPLVKTAMFGQDANWGRILTAAGYSGANFNPDAADVYIGDVMTCHAGTALPFDEDAALEVLKGKEILITINLKDGDASDRMWTCDFSYDYVKINGSYRT